MVYCDGFECPVKTTCMRFTHRKTGTQCVGGYTVIRKCTNQRRYLQNESKINKIGRHDEK